LINQAERIFRLASEKNIRRHVEIVEHVQLLMNERDAELHRVGDVVDFHRLAVNENFPGVGLMDAAEDFHQRGFARAVFAADAPRLRRARFRLTLSKRDDAGKWRFGNPAHFEQWRGGHFIGRESFSPRPDSRRRCPS
jgi:hypothetical protein